MLPPSTLSGERRSSSSSSSQSMYLPGNHGAYARVPARTHGKPPALGKQEKSTNLRKAKTKMDEEKTLERQRRVEALLKRPEERTREDVILLEDCLLNVKFFEDSERETRLELCRAVQYESFDPGYHVFREGDKGEKFYIILRGAVSVRHRDPIRQVDVTIATLSEGASFGELALLKGESNLRTASVLCTDRSEFLVLHRQDYNKILNSMINKDIEEKVKFLRNVKTGAFRDLTSARLESLSGVLNLRRYPKNGILVRQGDDADELFFIKRGECRIVKEMEMCPRLLQELASVSSRCPSALAEAMRSSSSYEREGDHEGALGSGSGRGGNGRLPLLGNVHPLRTVLNDYFKQCVHYKIDHSNESGLVSLVENKAVTPRTNGKNHHYSGMSSSSLSTSSSASSVVSASANGTNGMGAHDAPAPSTARTALFTQDKGAGSRSQYAERISEKHLSDRHLEDLQKEMMEMQREEGGLGPRGTGGAGAGSQRRGRQANGSTRGPRGERRRRKKSHRYGGVDSIDRLLSPNRLPSLASASLRPSNATKPIRVFLEVGLLGANDIFGEMGVTIKSKRACSVIANCQVEVYVLNKWELQRRLHDDVLLKILGKVSTYQSDEEIQREFISTLRWMEFKQSLIKDVTSSSRRAGTSAFK